ncbi:MAG: outer membrane lipoprotein-sorting protein [Elusimicrobia bacterium]|jgi:outer membrane lipoprotein-sorting protein|nr:outer membrane lipoprotein-sorting protein [Elusimicrobiota bacterium]
MKITNYILGFFLILIVFFNGSAISFGADEFSREELSGEEILNRIDENRTAENHISVSLMEVHGRRITRTMKAKTWTKGTDKSFTEYLEPPREAGTKMLKDSDNLWIYAPSADRIIKIAGHMLRQSMMGSDISYEDFMEEPVLSNIYSVKNTGDALFNERKCYLLELTALKEDISYHSRKVWVDKEIFLPLKEERYAKSGVLLKRFTIEESFKIENRWYPKKMIFKDMLSSGRGTTMTIESIEFNAEIPDYIFSKAGLRR